MIEAVMIDFGSVIYNADTKRALAAFSKYSAFPDKVRNLPDEDYDQLVSKYESGEMSSQEFYEFAREKLSLNATLEEFHSAWNKTLIGVYSFAFDSVTILKSNYKLLLLSNTSPWHYEVFEPECRHIFDLFEKTYFSHLVGLRKPDKIIYEYVMQESNLSPENVLFLDDKEKNLEGFQKIGGKTLLITKDFSLMDFAEKQNR